MKFETCIYVFEKSICIMNKKSTSANQWEHFHQQNWSHLYLISSIWSPLSDQFSLILFLSLLSDQFCLIPFYPINPIWSPFYTISPICWCGGVCQKVDLHPPPHQQRIVQTNSSPLDTSPDTIWDSHIILLQAIHILHHNLKSKPFIPRLNLNPWRDSIQNHTLKIQNRGYIWRNFF